MNQQTRVSHEGILATILSEESFWPAEPRVWEDLGLTRAFVEGLIGKRLLAMGSGTGRQLAQQICLPFALCEPVFQALRERRLVVHKGAAPLNDYSYMLTQSGTEWSRDEMAACSYSGPAPVRLSDYVASAEAQTIAAESPKRRDLEQAFKDVSVNREIFETLGPAVNSAAGLFLYGEPGNGKTTLAKRLIRCFGDRIWVPHAFMEDGQLVKVFDPALHEAVDEEHPDALSMSCNASDARWVRIKRPTVVVGGELTLDALEIRHDRVSNVSEAPLQVKSNCGCFLIDDFGRQRVEATQLLNRWIVPLENRIDYLTLATGKKIQVPFEQLIVFSTNLDPNDLVDEAFLRRIPYKVFVRDPERREFHALFRYYAGKFGCEYRADVVERLLNRHFFAAGRRLRRCHPRDLLQQVRNYCTYNEMRLEMRDEYFNHVIKSYFADRANQPAGDGRNPAPQHHPYPIRVSSGPASGAPQAVASGRPDADPRPATILCDPRDLPVNGAAEKVPTRGSALPTIDPRCAEGAPTMGTLACDPREIAQSASEARV